MTCDTCGGTGKLPIKDYAYGFYNCTCQPLPQEHYQPFNPDSIDFPCSRDFRRFYEVEGGRGDPGSTYPDSLPAPTEQVVIHRHSNMSPEEAKLLQNTARGLQSVGQTLKEHLNWKKPQVIARPGTGIKID